MIKLDKEHLSNPNRRSSKGNQMKWQKNGIWYKADDNGYEGLGEYVISKLLEKSSLKKEEYVDYDLETIEYGRQVLNGCKSMNFLKEGESIITLERLFESNYGEKLTSLLLSIDDVGNKIKFVVNKTEQITCIDDFGLYLSKILVIDSLFLNEDRHMNNIAVISDKNRRFRLCPIFDNGAALLSDTKQDYPLNMDWHVLIKDVRSKSFDDDFAIQTDFLEQEYGLGLTFSFNESDIISITDAAANYPLSVRERVKKILIYQRNKNLYYFDE